MKTLLPSERKELLIKLLQKPPRLKSGQVDWQTIWKQHPGYQEQLDATTGAGRKRMSVMVANIRSAGLVPKAPALATNGNRMLALDVTADAPAIEPIKDRTEYLDLVKAILENYKPVRNKIPWRRIFSEHPDYRVLLNATTLKGAQRVSYFARSILRKSGATNGHTSKAAVSKPKAAQKCVITGPGVSVEFDLKHLPTVLHAVALSIVE